MTDTPAVANQACVDYYNLATPGLAKAIVHGMRVRGGDTPEALLLLEGVIASVLVSCVPADRDDVARRALMQGLKTRVCELRRGLREGER